jgi:hypothetical protein
MQAKLVQPSIWQTEQTEQQIHTSLGMDGMDGTQHWEKLQQYGFTQDYGAAKLMV